MPNTTISPYMNMPIPVVGVDPGPDWANNQNASFSIIDSHDHSSGKGIQITPSGMDINADLTFAGNNATDLNAVSFQARVAALTTLLRSIQVVDKDMYFVDGDSNAIRITQSGSVTGSAGTITGLPSGTASAAFAAGTFTFQGATNTPATMALGPLILGAAIANPKTVTISASASQPANYNLTFPLDPPAANQVVISDGSGNLSWSLGLMPIGSVIATFPNLSGAYSTVATTAADAYGFVKCEGQTIADATSPMNGAAVPNINNSVFLMGSTTAGTTGGSATASGVGAHTHTFTSSTSVGSSSHTHGMNHQHQWGFYSNGLYTLGSSGTQSAITITGGDLLFLAKAQRGDTGSTQDTIVPVANGYTGYTTGALSAPSGSGSSAATGSPSSTTAVSGTTDSTGTSFSIVPPYISAVYLMRVK